MNSKLRRLEVVKTAEDLVKDAITLPIDPKTIANDRGILVTAMKSKTAGASGFLMKHGDSFGIGFSTAINNPGFINFTIAHELGHYFLEGHVEQLFSNDSEIHESKSGFVTADICEREADIFAASLLMPEKLFRTALRRAGQGFPAIEAVSQQCVTSITATAIRYAEFADDPVIVLVSHGGMVDFCCLSPAFKEIGDILISR